MVLKSRVFAGRAGGHDQAGNGREDSRTRVGHTETAPLPTTLTPKDASPRECWRMLTANGACWQDVKEDNIRLEAAVTARDALTNSCWTH